MNFCTLGYSLFDVVILEEVVYGKVFKLHNFLPCAMWIMSYW